MDLCIFVGRATRDPKIRQASNGDVANFTLAVDTGYGDYRKANFFEMVGFGRVAESIDKYIRQGTKIIVQSQAQQNVWTDKDGQKHYDVNFVIQSWEFAESKRTADDDGQQAAPRQAASTEKPDADGFVNVPDSIEEEDLPFA